MYRKIVHRAVGAKPADVRWKGFNDNLVGLHLRSKVGNHLEQVNSLLFVFPFVCVCSTSTNFRLPEMMLITPQIDLKNCGRSEVEIK